MNMQVVLYNQFLTIVNYFSIILSPLLPCIRDQNNVGSLIEVRPPVYQLATAVSMLGNTSSKLNALSRLFSQICRLAEG